MDYSNFCTLVPARLYKCTTGPSLPVAELKYRETFFRIIGPVRSVSNSVATRFQLRMHDRSVNLLAISRVNTIGVAWIIVWCAGADVSRLSFMPCAAFNVTLVILEILILPVSKIIREFQ